MNMFLCILFIGRVGLESIVFFELLKLFYSIMEGVLFMFIFGWGKNCVVFKVKKVVYEVEVYSYEKVVLIVFKEMCNLIVNFNKIKEVYDFCVKLECLVKSYVDLV